MSFNAGEMIAIGVRPFHQVKGEGVVGGVEVLDALCQPTVFPQVERETTTPLRRHVVVEEVVHCQLQPMPRRRTAGLQVNDQGVTIHRADAVSGASGVMG